MAGLHHGVESFEVLIEVRKETRTDGVEKPEVKILEEQPGSGVQIEKGALISCHFKGRLEDGTVFDSSEKHGKPYECVVGSKKLIAGWSLGLLGMCAGGKRKFFVPHELAYGERAVGNVIKAKSNLIYEVEVLEVRPRDS
jgi:FKBP-type peptidyl-prolyl cis-trans isomerase